MTSQCSPSVVRMIVPLRPTTQHTLADGDAPATRSVLTPLCWTRVAPSASRRCTIPFLPMIHMTDRSGGKIVTRTSPPIAAPAPAPGAPANALIALGAVACRCSVCEENAPIACARGAAAAAGAFASFIAISFDAGGAGAGADAAGAGADATSGISGASAGSGAAGSRAGASRLAIATTSVLCGASFAGRRIATKTRNAPTATTAGIAMTHLRYHGTSDAGRASRALSSARAISANANWHRMQSAKCVSRRSRSAASNDRSLYAASVSASAHSGVAGPGLRTHRTAQNRIERLVISVDRRHYASLLFERTAAGKLHCPRCFI